jgi:hypothetical protein
LDFHPQEKTRIQVRNRAPYPYTYTGSVFVQTFVLIFFLPGLLITNREAFSGFNVEAVAKYTEKQMASLSAGFGMDVGTVRGVVNNACRILEVCIASCLA